MNKRTYYAWEYIASYPAWPEIIATKIERPVLTLRASSKKEAEKIARDELNSQRQESMRVADYE